MLGRPAAHFLIPCPFLPAEPSFTTLTIFRLCNDVSLTCTNEVSLCLDIMLATTLLCAIVLLVLVLSSPGASKLHTTEDVLCVNAETSCAIASRVKGSPESEKVASQLDGTTV